MTKIILATNYGYDIVFVVKHYQPRRPIISLDVYVCLFLVFNVTFNNISVILWMLVLLEEETGGTRENHRPVANH